MAAGNALLETAKCSFDDAIDSDTNNQKPDDVESAILW